MKLYIKQKVFSWGDKFRVYDENYNDRYYVEGEVLSFGKKLHLYSRSETKKRIFMRKCCRSCRSFISAETILMSHR